MHLDQLLNPVFSFLAAICVPGKLNCTDTVAFPSAHAQWLLWNENFGSRLSCNILNCLTLLSDDETNVAISYIDCATWSAEWAGFSDVDTHL